MILNLYFRFFHFVSKSHCGVTQCGAVLFYGHNQLCKCIHGFIERTTNRPELITSGMETES
ncbi:Uncharacterised protein [Vibrio cholerae]|uniref:Uncharacterized protein n=1 Tax=Vibrio cholerae TaxID=666 RepID=A0A655YAY7_VIBCL|nr:Uncharacterised protein [Vibrio cholerae]CSB19879.1 Uncharacterised protein [Vibrio cholerae]CSB44697.1 Uncharacterised protein [Vibrio cholerae]CSC23808.1 Uncharacterised protein [Vibrio cholerae]CSC34848.1 Uncharacterised protein [Vibrio cholerae]